MLLFIFSPRRFIRPLLATLTMADDTRFQITEWKVFIFILFFGSGNTHMGAQCGRNGNLPLYILLLCVGGLAPSCYSVR